MITLMLAIAVHVLSGVFWAGTTFALARGQRLSAASLRKPQLGAAAVGLDQRVDQAQPEARAFTARLAAMEPFEQEIRLVEIKSGPVVAY